MGALYHLLNFCVKLKRLQKQRLLQITFPYAEQLYGPTLKSKGSHSCGRGGEGGGRHSHSVQNRAVERKWKDRWEATSGHCRPRTPCPAKIFFPIKM